MYSVPEDERQSRQKNLTITDIGGKILPECFKRCLVEWYQG